MAQIKKPFPQAARQNVRPLTPEEEKEQFMRAYMQKKASLAEGILFNMIHGQIVSDTKGVVKLADDMANEFMKIVYHQEIKLKEEE